MTTSTAMATVTSHSHDSKEAAKSPYGITAEVLLTELEAIEVGRAPDRRSPIGPPDAPHTQLIRPRQFTVPGTTRKPIERYAPPPRAKPLTTGQSTRHRVYLWLRWLVRCFTTPTKDAEDPLVVHHVVNTRKVLVCLLAAVCVATVCVWHWREESVEFGPVHMADYERLKCPSSEWVRVEPLLNVPRLVDASFDLLDALVASQQHTSALSHCVSLLDFWDARSKDSVATFAVDAWLLCANGVCSRVWNAEVVAAFGNTLNVSTRARPHACDTNAQWSQSQGIGGPFRDQVVVNYVTDNGRYVQGQVVDDPYDALCFQVYDMVMHQCIHPCPLTHTHDEL